MEIGMLLDTIIKENPNASQDEIAKLLEQKVMQIPEAKPRESLKLKLRNQDPWTFKFQIETHGSNDLDVMKRLNIQSPPCDNLIKVDKNTWVNVEPGMTEKEARDRYLRTKRLNKIKKSSRVKNEGMPQIN